MSDVWQEDRADLERGLHSLSPSLPESRSQELDEALLMELKRPSMTEVPLPKFSLRSFLRQTLIGTTVAVAVCGAFLLTSLKTPYTPPKSEMKPTVGITPPPPLSLDSLLREPSPRAASLWRRGASEPVHPFAPRKAVQDGYPAAP